MKKSLLVLLAAAFAGHCLQAQVVRTIPEFPSENDSVTVIFDASKGNAGLIGHTGDIWAHTGVITDKSSNPTDWKYVVANWNENKDKAKLKPLGNNLWELKIRPSIRSWYAVPASEKILKLAFVFRDATGTKTGRAADGSDIFADVYEAGLNVTIVQPETGFLAVEPGSFISVSVSSTKADSTVLYRDEVRLAGTNGNSLNYSLDAGQGGYHKVKAKAFGNGDTVEDAFDYLVKGQVVIADLPAGVKDGINYRGADRVVLVLFAPAKEFCFVIGDFTEWTVNEDFLMKRTPDGKRYWIELTGLQTGKEYQFQYLVNGEIRIADPYSEKISDPWNDGYIEPETYPGLIPYPVGKTTQAVSVIQTGQVPYNWKINEFAPPAASKLVIYELLLRDFLAAHSFEVLIDTLDYIKNLGINAIELMPVSEFEGNDSWGYNPSFYFAVDKYYGPKESFKAFVDAAHQRGIAVLMDMVLNHSYGQSPLVRLYWDASNNRPSPDNPWYNVQSPNNLYSWGYDFNHQSPETQRFVDSVNSYWLREYHVDGFRFDFTKGFTNVPGDGGSYDASRIAILKRMADRIRETEPDAVIILEHFAAWQEEKELSDYGMLVWGNSNNAYRQAAGGWYAGGQWDFSGISYLSRNWTKPGFVGYMESHDEERLLYDCLNWGNTQNPSYNIKSLPVALKRMELAANLFIPVPGPKMIWMFGELGYDYSINYGGRVGKKPVRWDYLQDPYRKRLYQVYSALNKLKTSQEVFSTPVFETNFQDSIKRLRLDHSSMNALILGNFGIRTSRIDPRFRHDGWWYDYWTGDSLKAADVERIVLQPGEYRLYTDIRLEKPDIISSVSGWSVEEHSRISIYPNPGNGTVCIESELLSVSGCEVIFRDIRGVEVLKTMVSTPITDCRLFLDTDPVSPGIYLIEVRSRLGRAVIKWIRHS